MNFISNLIDKVTPEYTELRVGGDTYSVPNPSKVNSHERAVWFLDHITSCARLTEISKKQLIKIINLLVKDTFNPKTYLENIEKLEKCFLKSKKYTLEKATKVFLEHIEGLQKEKKFDVNQTFAVKSGERKWDPLVNLTPIGFAAMRKAPALLNALIKAGGNVNCGERNEFQTCVASPLHLIFVNQYFLQKDIYDEPSMHQLGSYSNHYRSFKLQGKCIDILKQYGCEPNSTCKSNLIDYSWRNYHVYNSKLTPIWIALLELYRGKLDTDTMTSLVQAKADINFQSVSVTPLQYAAIRIDDIGITKILVQLGADLFVTTEEGRTVCDLCKSKPTNPYAFEENEDNFNEKYKYLKEEMKGYKLKAQATLLKFIPVKPLTSIVIEYLCGSFD